MKLSELRNGQTVYVAQLNGSWAFQRRMEEMGFVGGQAVTRQYASPLGTPILFSMMGQQISLRLSEAERVDVCLTEAEAQAFEPSEAPHTPSSSPHLPIRAQQCKGACGGCPSCGHSSHAEASSPSPSGLHIALVGNPNCGKTAFFNAACGGHERTGNYAGITVGSVDGHRVWEGHELHITDLPGTYSLQAFSPEEAYVANELASGHVDVIVNILDVNNLERNLLLTLQLKELGLPMLGVLNLYDEFESHHSILDIPQLEERLGIPLVKTIASHGHGVEEVLQKAVEIARRADDAPLHDAHRQTATQKRETLRARLERAMSTTAREHRRATLALLDGIYTRHESRAVRTTAVIDRLLARSPLSYLLFFVIMGLIFYITFQLGAYPMDWMEKGVDALSAVANAHIPRGWLRDLLVGGILGGVGSVIVFLPNILILYFFISILEDSGYLARAAFLADPLLRRVGLHGKSFVPMLMGFGCNVPAVMTTRTIESRKSRLLTMMTLPFMSCSARLPIYTVLAGAFFPQQAAWVMLGLYTLGILTAFCAAGTLSHFFHRSEESHFVMEMPPYRRPVAISVLRHTWEKGRQYLRKMGGIILVASVVVWALGYFPATHDDLTPAEQQEQSYLGQIGHAISPVISPLGYDWRLGVGIISGVGAKELMVSTLGVLYNVPEDDVADGNTSDVGLTAALQRSGTSSASALSYMVFALLYFPCLATIAAIRGESGRWRYALFTAAYTTVTAYVMAWAVYRLAGWFLG